VENSISLPAELGELLAEEAALDASERIDSSLILVFRGSSILTERIAPCAAALMAS
jgi:hypothetical protein